MQNVTFRCEECIHKEVCGLKPDVENATLLVSEAVKDIKAVYRLNIDIKCNNYMSFFDSPFKSIRTEVVK